MSHRVTKSRNAQRFLDKLLKQECSRIEDRLRRLQDNPVPQDAKFIGRDRSEEMVFRYRIGDYRALYKVKGEIVLIVLIDKRSRVYD